MTPTTFRRRCGPGTSPAAASSPTSTGPIAGATHDQELPVGKHPFQLYSLATPNGQKVAIMFEELLEQRPSRTPNMTPGRSASARATNSPAASSPSTPIPRSRRWSTAAAPSRCACSNPARSSLHLAEKFGEFLPASGPERAETLSWLFWQMGSAPFLGGGFGHFFAYAPDEVRISDQPLCDGGQAPARRPQPPPRRERIYRRAPTIRSPTSRSGRGTAASRSAAATKAPTSSSRPTNMSM